MLNNNNIVINLPSSPYPDCPNNLCDGMLLPKIRPAIGVRQRGPNGVNGEYEVDIPGTAVLFWQCNSCKAKY